MKINCKQSDRLKVIRTIERYILDGVTAPVSSAVTYLLKYGNTELSVNQLFSIARSAKYPVLKRGGQWYENVTKKYDKNL